MGDAYMGFGTPEILSIERVIDDNPVLYLKRAENFLKQYDIEKALIEIDKAIRFSNNDSQYIFEKIKVLHACSKHQECIALIFENLQQFENKFSINRFKLVLEYLRRSLDIYNASIDGWNIKFKASHWTITKKNNVSNPQYGIIFDIDSSIYWGELKEDQKYGRGTQIIPEVGQKYVGEWKDNVRSGEGVYTWPSGNKYVGEFNNGVMSGIGTFTFPTGQQYIGMFKNNKINGQGVMTYADGTRYIGEFKNGEPTGAGTRYQK